MPAAIAAQTVSAAPTLRMYQRPRIFEIGVANSRGRPEGERGKRACRVVACVLRERARSHDEEVRNVPRLEIFVERARLRIGTHDRAAVEMRRLILGDVVGCLARLLVNL